VAGVEEASSIQAADAAQPDHGVATCGHARAGCGDVVTAVTVVRGVDSRLRKAAGRLVSSG
jgi:hypothetical protein